MLGYMLCILVGAPLGILLGKVVGIILRRALWGDDYDPGESIMMEVLVAERGGFHFINPNEMEILDRIAEVVPIRQIWLEGWRVAGECLRVSEIDFEKLAKRPSWEQFMKTRFFDSNGSYFHPLLFVRQSARPSGFIIDKDPVFTRVWLRYNFPPTILRWDRWDMICVNVRGISESEALALESRNIEMISQVDSILDSACTAV